jgi:Spy/CpxP family protein refolding chaperone
MMRKFLAVVLLALFSATVAFATTTPASTGTPVPVKSAKKHGKHHGKKCKTAKPAATPAAAK